LQLELELVSNFSDAFEANKAAGAADRSTTFKLENVQLKCDLCTLDNTLDNEYTASLMEGKSLPIHFTGLATGSQISHLIKMMFMCQGV